MFTLKRELETMFLLFVAAGIGVFISINLNRNRAEVVSQAANVQEVVVRQTDQNKQGSSFIPKITASSQNSSDGNVNTHVESSLNRDGSQAVSIFATDGSDRNKKVIFNTTLQKEDQVVIPYNTWSPDNKYFFIRENTTGGPRVMVFRGDGEPFADGETFLDLTGVFAERNTDYKFDEATGWASETLIIINTTRQDNTKGPSFWFEVPSKAVIQLSTIF